MEYTLLESLLAPFSYPLDPGKRVFWGFLLSSLLIVCIYYYFKGGARLVGLTLAPIVRWRYWINTSVLTDVCLMFTNSVIRLVMLVPLFGARLAFAIAVALFLQTNLGDAPEFNVHWFFVASLYSVCFFLMEDVTRFLLHYAAHKNAFLWRFHKTHHSATVLNPLTNHRVHPVEMTLYFLRGMVVFGIVGGAFLYFFRGNFSGWDILGVEALGFLFNLFGSNLRHTPIWISFGKLERVFISPAQHQIHHSTDPRHMDQNMGTCLALWDRLMGTWMPAKNETVTHYGLTNSAELGAVS